MVQVRAPYPHTSSQGLKQSPLPNQCTKRESLSAPQKSTHTAVGQNRPLKNTWLLSIFHPMTTVDVVISVVCMRVL